MAIEIKHQFTSLKGDGGDATLVKPSHWNAAHSTSMATGKLIGRLTGGVGAFEEITISAYMASLLATADAAALIAALGLPSTGDTKATINSVANAGWIAYAGVGTIGKSGSGASVRANDDTAALYHMIYAHITDAFCAVSGGRSGNSVTDFNAGKTIDLPWFSGRAIIGAGGGGSLTTRAVGQYFGAETHTLTTAELASHYHAASIYDPTHTHSHNITAISSSTAVTGGGGITIPTYGGATISAAATGVRVNSSNGLDTTYSAGGGGAHNNMQPSIPLWIHVKL